ncbi:hypothetical protein K8I28_07545, partial [bacterium]|nr:hypothetical protein [bacterium]
MRKPKLLTQLYPAALFVVLLTYIALGWLGSRTIWQYFLIHSSDNMTAFSDVIVHDLDYLYGSSPEFSLEEYIRTFKPIRESELSLFSAQAKLIGTTIDNEEYVRSLTSIPEFHHSLHDSILTWHKVRVDDETYLNLFTYLSASDKFRGVLHARYSMRSYELSLQNFYSTLILLCLLTAGLLSL